MTTGFLRHPVAANLLFFGILILGFGMAPHLRQEVFPILEPRSIQVSVRFPGATADELDETIIEGVITQIESVDGIDRTTARSVMDQAVVHISAEKGVDINRLHREVQSRITAIPNWPERAHPAIVSIIEDRRRVCFLEVQRESHVDRNDWYQSARRLRQELLNSEDINRVEIQGIPDKDWIIEVDESALHSLDLTFAEVEQMIAANLLKSTGGTIQSSHSQWQIRSTHDDLSIQLLEALPIRRSDSTGSVLLLGQVAKIRAGWGENTPVLRRFNGRPSVTLEILATKRDHIAEAEHAALEILEQVNYPGLKISLWHSESRLITSRLSSMLRSGVCGIVIVLIMLAIFLNSRVALTTALGIPFAIAGTLLLMPWFDISLNSLSTFGFIMVLGILVDDAVVVGESIFHSVKSEGQGERSILLGLKGVQSPVLFGILTTLAAFLPLGFIDGREGAIFGHIAWVVVLCLFFSLIHAKWILPVQMSAPKSKKVSQWESYRVKLSQAIENRFRGWYSRLLESTLSRPVLIVSLAIGVLLITMALPGGKHVRSVFFPAIQFEQVIVWVETDPDLSFRGVSDLAKSAEKVLGKTSAIQTRVAKGTGRIELIFNRNGDISRMFPDWHGEILGLPGVRSVKFSTNGRDPSTAEDFRLEISGRENEIRLASVVIRQELEKYSGVSGVTCGFEQGRKELRLVTSEEGRAHGVTERMLSAQIRSAVYGGQAYQLPANGQSEVRVLVRSANTSGVNPAELEQSLRIRAEQGRSFRLHDVADIHEETVPVAVERSNGIKVHPITVAVDKSITAPAEVVKKAEKEILPDLQKRFPNLAFQFAGENTERRKSMSSLIHALVLSLLAIYSLLAIALRSFLQPFLILAIIPFGLCGAIFGHLILNLPFSLLSFFGVLALGGVVVNDALLLISTAKQYYQTTEMSWTASVREACQRRFRAVMLTSATTFGGLVPLLCDQSVQGQYLVPMAASLAFGVLAATVITLVLLPAILSITKVGGASSGGE